jgi:deoxycytidylate deaminase
MKQPEPYLIALAIDVSKSSACQSKRGCVIWNPRGVVSTGYNHIPRPFECDGSDRCKATCGKTAVHAEQSAILRAERSQLPGSSMLHVKIVNGVLVAGGGPSCLECSKLILESKIATMWLYERCLPLGERWVQYSAKDFHRETLHYHYCGATEVIV